METGPLPVYDLGEIRRAFGGGGRKGKENSQAHFSLLQRKILTELATAVESNDSPLAHRMAHTIKGAASQVGAEGMRSIAFDMEALGKEGELKVIGEKLPALKEAFLKVKNAMKGEL